MSDPMDALVVRTRRRLAAVMLLLVAALIAAVGVVTALVGLAALDGSVDRALRAAAATELVRLDGTLPGAAGTSGSGDSEPGEGAGEDRAPASSDTFFLVLSPGGTSVSNPSRVTLAGLPSAGAVASARASGEDVRDITAEGIHLRLLTLPIQPHEAEGGRVPVGYLQAGFVLTLRDEQQRGLVVTIALVGVAGLAGAALVTLVVTRRALVPVRAAFARERRFVADASHELRTPAALIRASAEILDRESLVAAEGRPLISDIVSEADRLGRLVGDLLALSSGSALAPPASRVPMDLAAITADTMRMAVPLASEHDVRLAWGDGRPVDSPAVRLAGGPPSAPVSILGDRDRLVQLLLVLLDNAFRHSPHGATVRVDVEQRGDRAEVSVSDEGTGIPVADRERIFEPFARLGGTRASGDTGSGLGLAIARSIALAHGGSLRCEEAAGGGARFVLSVPMR